MAFDIFNNLSPSDIINNKNEVGNKSTEYNFKRWTDGSAIGDIGPNDDDITRNIKIAKASVDHEDWNNLLRSRMIIYEDRDKWTTAFNRMQFPNHHNKVDGTREYIFFTKPDLNIMHSQDTLNAALAGYPFWIEMKNSYRRIISDLQISATRPSIQEDKQQFIPLLTNAIAGTLDLPSITADTTETGSTIYGTEIQYRKGSMKSDESFDFSLEMVDNPYLEVYHFFKMYDEYETLKDLGIVGPASTITLDGKTYTSSYIRNKILHDQIAIFRFLVNENDMGIIHYSKLVGCFPKSVPREAMSQISPGLIKYTIDWHAQFIEDMNPLILEEFNSLCIKYLGGEVTDINKFIDPYNKRIGDINGSFANCPYIIYADDPSSPTGRKYKLMWIDSL